MVKEGNISADTLPIMENVAFYHSFQTLTCDVFSEVVALFLAGSFIFPGTLGEGRVGNGQEEVSVSKCAIF